MGREQKEGGEALDVVSPEHYWMGLSTGETSSVSCPLWCLCSVLFLLTESSPVPLSFCRSLSLFLSRLPSWFSLSLRLLRLLPSLRSFRSFFFRPENEEIFRTRKKNLYLQCKNKSLSFCFCKSAKVIFMNNKVKNCSEYYKNWLHI